MTIFVAILDKILGRNQVIFGAQGFDTSCLSVGHPHIDVLRGVALGASVAEWIEFEELEG